jgi:serine/threonine-protein kinase
VAYVVREVLKALDYAHNLRDGDGRPLRIVHRDISPDNIMVSARGEVKLLDFGLVKSATVRLSQTEIGVVKGNVAFMSPEQAQGLEIDGRTDLYALALVAIFALTGRPLYQAQTTYGLLLEAGSGPDPAELAAHGGLPEAWRPILLRALAPRIEDRYQSARQMAEALAGLPGGGARDACEIVERLFKKEIDAESRRLASAPSVPDLPIVPRAQVA